MVNICLKSDTFCLYFILYLHLWILIRVFPRRIRFHKAPENGSNTDPDPQPCLQHYNIKGEQCALCFHVKTSFRLYTLLLRQHNGLNRNIIIIIIIIIFLQKRIKRGGGGGLVNSGELCFVRNIQIFKHYQMVRTQETPNFCYFWLFPEETTIKIRLLVFKY